MGLRQTKQLLGSKGNHQQNETLTTEREKIFANHISDKGLTSKIYKELIQFNSNKTESDFKIRKGYE